MIYSCCKRQPFVSELSAALNLAYRAVFRTHVFTRLYNTSTDICLKHLTFTGPCIANIFAENNQQDAKFHNLFISLGRSTCFRRIFPSIIRSSKLHIQRQIFVRPILLPPASQYLSDRYCYLLLASICQTFTATCC